MKKLLKPLFTALFAGMVCTGAKAAEPQVINIRTNDLSMVMSVAPNGEVLFHHFGGRIDDASPAAGIKSYRRTDHGTDNLAYSTMGGRNFREPALRVTHADGDMNTELRYVSHATRTLADKNVSETVVKLTDTDQALDVELVYTAYAKENVITTHTVIRNREKGDAVLHAFYSSSLPVKARSYLLTHLYGSWARESQTDHTLLTHGSKSIESRKLVRTTHTENPAFMITLDSEAFDENYGEVIAGALAWSGNFRLNFEVDEFNVLNILAGVNPYASDYTLAKGESFTTPEMVYTYSFEGAGGASRNLHDWARNYGVWHGHTYAPTLLNSWEGAYFTFDAKTLTDMIDDAADMGLEMFVLDDGFQHVKVRRDLDIVLLRPDDLGDGWGRVIPAGAWREGPEALERADVFMIKCSPEAWESLRPACERRLAGFRRPLFSFSLRPGSLRKIGTGECRDADAFAGKPYALATGVGDPAQVWETVARFMGREPAEYIVYPDHHAYTPEDAAKLEGLGMSVICTSKDAVKLRELRLADAWALRVEAAFGPALWTEAAFPHWLDAWAKRKGLF